jgi:hypothetical protein
MGIANWNVTEVTLIPGKLGITLNIHWCEPLTNSTEDLEACERYQQFRVSAPFLLPTESKENFGKNWLKPSFFSSSSPSSSSVTHQRPTQSNISCVPCLVKFLEKSDGAFWRKDGPKGQKEWADTPSGIQTPKPTVLSVKYHTP